MAFDGTLLSRPSVAVEQPLADALVLSYAGVYAAPPSAAMLSPNGDGVGDTRDVRLQARPPSHVVADAHRPGRRARTLADDDEQPGVHTLDLGRHERRRHARGRRAPGASTVTATDDLGRTTTAERDVSLDDTLGSLAVAPAAAHLAPAAKTVVTATFQLQHAARVVVTVESRANGTVIATLLNGDLQPRRRRRVAWDGRAWTGKLAFTGAYDLRVDRDERRSATVCRSLAPFTAAARRPARVLVASSPRASPRRSPPTASTPSSG